MNEVKSVDRKWFYRVLVEYYIAGFTGFNFELRLRLIVAVQGW